MASASEPHGAASGRGLAIEDRPRRVVGLVVLALAAAAVVAFAVYWQRGLTVEHVDAKAHLVVARRIIDDPRPAWRNHGVGWLPLVHLLYLPLVANWWLYSTGLAGTLISMIATVWAGYFCFRLTCRITGSPWAGAAAAAILGLHPGVLYLATAPMTEPVFFALMLGSLTKLAEWSESTSPRTLAAAAVLCAASALTRYSGWLLVGAESLVVALTVWRRRGPARALGTAAWFVPLAASGILLMLVHTWHVTGSPWQIMGGVVHEGSPHAGRPFAMAAWCARAWQQATGLPWWCLAAALGGYAVRRRLDPVGLCLLAPIVCVWAAGVIDFPLRVRYALLAVPAFAVWTASALVPRRRQLVVGMVLVAVAGLWWLWIENGVLRETLDLRRFLPHRPAAIATLRRLYDGQRILTGGGRAAEMYDLKIPLRRFVLPRHPWMYDAVCADPAATVGWIFLERNGKLDQRLRHQPGALVDFQKIYDRGRWLVYRLAAPL